MSIAVHRVFWVRDLHLVDAGAPLNRTQYRLGDAAALLTRLPAATENQAPPWQLEIEAMVGSSSRRVLVPLQAFLTVDDLKLSYETPFSLTGLWNKAREGEGDADWLWLFRDALYVAERAPRPSEYAEVELRIKALHFQSCEELRRLREQVANYEAIQDVSKRSALRRAIPDDVKLLVWSRDNGQCVRCGATQALHYDHIIPLSRGGSDESENIQLLCRGCNLQKGGRLV